ncbi:hypothetical protein NLO95_20330 [Pseudomonas syringae]|nr:hypothetical protein [Pseudomonas syringae]
MNGIMKVSAAVGLLASAACMTLPGLAAGSNTAQPSAGELEAVLKGVMNSAYGADNYDASRQCWKHSFQAGQDSLDYCMLGTVSRVVSAENGSTVYVQAHSDPEAEIYSQVDSGLEGLFLAGLDANQNVKLLASRPAIDKGQAGDCGCLDAKVIQVGPDRYGWLSTTGGIWQGVQVTRYSLEVPVGDEIRDVSGIPQISENSPDETHELKIKSDGGVVAGMYPLEVVSKRGDKVLDTRLVQYDEAKRIYPWAQ